MDYASLRAQLNEFQLLGASVFEQVKNLEDSDISAVGTSVEFQQLIAQLNEAISRSEAKEKLAAVLSRLKRFCCVVSSNADIEALLNKHKLRVEKQLKQPDGDIFEFAKPYLLFLALVDDNNLDMSEEEISLIGGYFEHSIIRPLYQGKLTVAEGWIPEPNAINERAPAAPVGAAAEEETDENEDARYHVSDKTGDINAAESFVIRTLKDNSAFSTKAFISDYIVQNAKSKGKIALNPTRVGELKLLHGFAWLGALTERQLDAYFFDEKIKRTNLDNIVKNGYVSSIYCNALGLEFFALSEKGAKIFEKEKSRELLKRIQNLPSNVWDASRSLPEMGADIDVYERVLSAALCLHNAEFEGKIEKSAAVGRIVVEHNAETANYDKTAIHLKARRARDDAEEDISLALFDDAGKVMVAAIDIETLRSGDQSDSVRERIERFANKIYFCEVSSDGVSVEFRHPDGIAIEIDAMLTEMFGRSSYSEFADDTREPIVEGAPERREEEICSDPTETVEDDDSYESYEIEDNFAMSANDEPATIAQKLLEDGILPGEREPFDMLTRALLCKAGQATDGKTDYLGRAVLLMKALALANGPMYGEDYECLLLATDLRYDTRNYTSEKLLTLFSEKNKGAAMHLAVLLRALFRPDSEYDYFSLVNYADSILKDYDNIFKDFIGLKQTLNAFIEIKKFLREGFTDKMTSRLVDAQTKNDILQRLSEEANRFKEPPRISQRVNGVPDLLAECFGENSLLGLCMKIIVSRRNKERQNGERNDVQEIYSAFLEGDKISHAKIIAALDESWHKVRTRHMVPEIVGVVRDKIIKAIYDRLDLIERWLNCTDSGTDADSTDTRTIISKIQKVLRDSIEQLQNDGAAVDSADKAVLYHALSSMLNKLSGGDGAGFIAEDWLSGGILPIESGVPDVGAEFAAVENYEPWRNVLRHIRYEPQELYRVLERIETPGDQLYDNLGQAILICEHLKEPERADLYRKGIPNAQKAAETDISNFMSRLEIDYAYGRVDESTKEAVLGSFESLKPEFWETSNFAQFRFFIDALRATLDKEVARNHAIWSSIIAERRKQGSNAFLDRAERFLQSENANFILVEEALNNFDSNAMSSSDIPFSEEEDLLAEFTARANYEELLGFCRTVKGKNFRTQVSAYVGDKVEKAGLSKQYINSAKTLAMSLPDNPQVDGSNEIKKLLEELGFNVSQVARVNPNATPARFTAAMTPDARNRANYNHPIAEMGTRIAKELNIVELFGSVEPESIISEVRKVDSRYMPIVFLNGALALAQRRQLAKLFLKDGKSANPFILVDWVLLLHLAVKVRDDRLRTMLACALPYTGTKQLFSRTSTIPIADEMYIGRSDEMSKILDMNGPVIVYGGRQLGKTALLQRAKNRFHIPGSNDFSVFIYAKSCGDERTFASLMCKELGEVGIRISKSDSVSDVCDDLRVWFKPGNRRLLMLVDEADKLLSELADVDNYAPLTPLENLCRIANGSFKFVFAGLHNVFLAAKDSNTIFGHFGNPLCIKPMSPPDAYKLLARPLSYLGFSTNPDMLLRLLVNTNFYPGVVHFVGAELIDMLMNKYAEHFNDKNNPPYELTERQIGAIMSSAELTSWIEERIRMTIEVDRDYLSIVRCVALLYYLEAEKRGRGYAPEEILKCATEMEVESLRNMGKDKCVHLLSELCDMSILVEMGGLYRFRQLRFLNIVGKSGEEIMERLSNGETVNNV
jgi:hypothetical protein